MPDLSRRRLLTGAGIVVGAGAAAAAGAGLVRQAQPAPVEADALGGAIPFHGAHQAGIATPVQDRLYFAAFDLSTDSREKVVAMLQAWTAAAVRLTAAQEVGGGATGAEPAPPDDTGEAIGLPASRLTLTVGFGPSFFDKLKLPGPERLKELPHFPADKLDPARSGGDVCVQACADDPQVAVHAVRNLVRIGFGTVSVRWSQLGFGKTSSTTPDAQTPRNLMGFKDGTNNIAGTDRKKLDEHVWVGDEGPEWMRGGSYLVARRIRMHIETWDRTSLKEQEDIFGRTKREGAPYGGTREHDPVVLDRMPIDSHVRLASPASLSGATILRRGYSFTDGSDGLGRLDAGLFFLAYQRDPEKGFIPIQRALAATDPLNEYIQHVGSGVFACPGGVRPGSFWGQGLLD
ncbi:iron uptake transporter deferrochelatase/peroxidase subunit [Streptosporangium roseum]|uniref:Deferrochelatase n=1 Tax=Streptosporangium roseum (strain ATCC 12428 / DSM 43021 / JCM 3005 / KCTC 9067 / NCIMB 10171 / NRRL 2505 / NI 9100) TaxID=479432 RepID=D2B169_STRRD|nr:iron uptake transporter deferrochelatase/peroxidase subunit [Streptosporangium roseum]ACZ85334.1 Dyp-type peroxidase [Streptosporangium roseum DSM 43021]